MFATLLSTSDASATVEERVAAVAALGGPYLTDRVDELAAARAAGLLQRRRRQRSLRFVRVHCERPRAI
ncbi:MAG: hypothetical protein ACO3GA_00860 [Candidatus Limnocylindrus sp.]